MIRVSADASPAGSSEVSAARLFSATVSFSAAALLSETAPFSRPTPLSMAALLSAALLSPAEHPARLNVIMHTSISENIRFILNPPFKYACSI